MTDDLSRAVRSGQLPPPCLSLSIVSHGQAALVSALLIDLEAVAPRDFEVVVTLNIEEPEPSFDTFSFPIRIIRNGEPKGFGGNHNQAFRASRGRFFAVVNPDIRLPAVDFAALAAVFDDPRVGACGPLVVGSDRAVQDSARHFPTLATMLRRLVKRPDRPDYNWTTEPVAVDWLAGMFVVFRPQAFASVGGFDEERFFMYYEDVDIGRRLAKHGWRSVLVPATTVVHDAQRASHRNPRHLRWHVTSAVRYLTGL